jgi:CNT family concentrative nucleoside transporter
MQMIQPVIGIFVFFLICYFLSENRRDIKYFSFLRSLITQMALAVIILQFPPIKEAFYWMGEALVGLKNATIAGTSFVFGYIGGGEHPFEVTTTKHAFIFGFQVLPMVIVISALSMLLSHWRILPFVFKGLSWVFSRLFGVSGGLGAYSAVKVFFGQTEAPLFIRAYLGQMSRGELFTVVVLGFATTSAVTIPIYATILGDLIPNIMTHLLTASIINIPAAIALSRVLIPYQNQGGSGDITMPYKFPNTIEAISKGTADGARMYLALLAMFIVFIALVSLGNKLLAFLPYIDGEAISIQRILGYIMSPLSWLMGIPWSEAKAAGTLLGIKTTLNELFAYTEMAQVYASHLSEQSRIIITYALFGFANFCSIGMVVACLGTLVPERQTEISALSMKALIVGTLASCLSGSVIAILGGF